MGKRLRLAWFARSGSHFCGAVARMDGCRMISRRYMRALLMPALTVANQPATLLCASMPFREHCKVYLKCDGVNASSKLQLTRRLLATSSVSQFEFRVLEGELKVKPGA